MNRIILTILAALLALVLLPTTVQAGESVTYRIAGVESCTIAGSRAYCAQLGEYRDGALVQTDDISIPAAVTGGTPVAGSVTEVKRPGWFSRGKLTDVNAATFKWSYHS